MTLNAKYFSNTFFLENLSTDYCRDSSSTRLPTLSCHIYKDINTVPKTEHFQLKWGFHLSNVTVLIILLSLRTFSVIEVCV